MQAATGRFNALRCMQSGGSTDHDEVHWAMRKKLVEFLKGAPPISLTQGSDTVAVPPIDRHDFNSGNLARRADVCLADIARANQADTDSHRSVFPKTCCSLERNFANL
jgi:hypothetical protein